MEWKIITTERFSQESKKLIKNKQFFDALDKKIKRLCFDPNIGSFLSGSLHGYKSIRLLNKYRIIYRTDEKIKTIYLIAIDHRKHNYERF